MTNKPNIDPFASEKQNLFNKVLVLTMIFTFITLIGHLITWNIKEAIFSGSTFILTCICFGILRAGHPQTAYVVFPILVVFLINKAVIFDGGRYESIFLIFSGAILYGFIYLKKGFNLVAFLIFLVLNQFLIFYYNCEVYKGPIDGQVKAEILSITVFNIITSLLAHFYFSTLNKTNVELGETLKEVSNQEDILRKKNEELTAYMESNLQLENYAYLAAHELKAPVNSIQSFTKLVGSKIDDKLDDQEKEMFGFIAKQSAKMNVLLDDLHVLSKVKKNDLRIETVDIPELVDEIKIDRAELIEQRSGLVEYQGEILEINGQRSLLKQLFSNLIGNGLKFVHPDETPHVKVDSKSNGDVLEFKIMDNGIGIEPEYRDKIFQIFTRLHSDSKFEGSGIGLAICRKIVDQHKGTISVDDSPLGGTCFVIRLPKIEASAVTVNQSETLSLS